MRDYGMIVCEVADRDCLTTDRAQTAAKNLATVLSLIREPYHV